MCLLIYYNRINYLWYLWYFMYCIQHTAIKHTYNYDILLKEDAIMSKIKNLNMYTKVLFFTPIILIASIIMDIVLDLKTGVHSGTVIIDAFLIACAAIYVFSYQIIKQSNNRLGQTIDSQQKEIEKINKLMANLKVLYSDAIDYNSQKSDFFANLSHELKTPISIVLGAIQLIDQHKTTTLERRRSSKQLQTIKQNCYRLLRLVNNILDISRIDSGFVKANMENCNIVYLIEEITQSVVPFAEQKDISLEFDTESEEIITAVDIDKIERIILNLLSNAIKFTSHGGKITVNVYSRDNRVLVSVKDTGPGIPKQMQAKIFERFQQVGSALTREFEGSGIGLSLVKSFVNLHNGLITVNSELNKGSEFILEFPIILCDQKTENTSQKVNPQNKIVEAIKTEFSDIYYVSAS